MKRDVLIIASVFIFGALVFFGLINNLNNEVSLSPEVTYSPTITYPSCSNQSIASLWDQIFTESSSGINIYYEKPLINDSFNGCPYFIAYKNKSQDFYFLTGNENWPTNNVTSNGTNIVAFKANITQEYINNINNEGIKNYTKFGSFSSTSSMLYVSPSYLNARTTGINESNQVFLSTFKLNEDSNFSEQNSTYYYFNFSKNYSINSKQKFVSAIVSGNYGYDYFSYSDNDFSSSSCTPNYIPVETTQCVNGSIVVQFRDISDCDFSPKENVAFKCPINSSQIENSNNVSKNVSEHISGNLTKFLQNNTDLIVYIDNNLLNLSQVINDTKTIEFKKSSDTLVKFDYNFSSSNNINIDSVQIMEQNSSYGFGYLIVNGLSFNKTLYIDRIANEDYICIRNSHVNNIDSFSSNCNSGSEILLLCPGTSNNIKCDISGSKFIVSGLTNSGVMEFISNSSQSSSSSSTSASQNSILNNIAANSQPVACSPLWTCDSWTPEPCSRRQNQTRVCTDANSCSTLANKPSEVQECDAKSPLPIIIFYSTLTLIIASIIVVIIMFYLSTKKKERFGHQKLI